MTVRLAELCCGSAAVSLALVGGESCRPPVSYQGSKRGYAAAVLAALDLVPGQGAAEVWLNDPGPWAVVWAALADVERRAEVARIIRGWVGEEPRALWERLRVEVGGPGETPGDVAAWLWTHLRSYQQRGPQYGFRPALHPYGSLNYQPKDPAPAIEALPGPDGLSVTRADALTLLPPPDASRWVLYLDPPYANTTGYAHDLPRSAVLEVALRWAAAGARVAVSEAEPLPLPGWHAVEITRFRRGPTRTFSAQQAEWLTLSAPPPPLFAVMAERAHTAGPAVEQLGLFGGGL